MKNSRLFPIWAFLFFMLFSCSSDEVVDTPNGVDELQNRISAIVSEQNRNTLQDLGIALNAGTNPPVIEGNFRIGPKTLQATTVQGGNQAGHIFPDAGIRFFDQAANNIKVQGVNFIGQTFMSSNAIIVGSGNNFTVYVKGTATREANSAVFDVIISGVKDGENIRNLRAAYTNVNNSNGGNQFIPQGSSELVYDAGNSSQTISSLEEVMDTDPDDNGDDQNGDDDNGGNGDDVEDSDVYVVGYQRLRGANRNIATLWHKGEITILEDEGKFADAHDITFKGEDMIITGYLRPSVNSNQTEAVYWENFELKKLPSNGQWSQALAVFVDGNDLYFSGSLNNKAAIWKNGTIQELVTRGTSSIANDIFVENGDVYVAGREVYRGKSIGVLWKNGEPTYLSEESRNVNIHSVGVLNGDVYVSGGENSAASSLNHQLFARYWKNGEPVWLLEGPWVSLSRALTIYKNEVYFSYYESGSSFTSYNLFVMKGSEKKQIFSGKPSQADAIAVKGNNTYVAGHISYQAAYIKNETPVILPKSEPTGDTAQTGAFGIYVKQ